ncbi:hypothetical protein [Amycolatopsis sp. MtRt-6]|uniref:hypothetical protein n=1 Tax=Amycolatopsis sp. MtRt-6 TaxID=2792782 RepID=UPI001A8D827A|nr:hypothetical protein [Amycolatopsis sp. MtRt-6]
MTSRRRTVVVVALAVAAVALGASAVAGLLGAGDPAAPAGPAVHTDPDCWTGERVRGAQPAPMPTPPGGR